MLFAVRPDGGIPSLPQIVVDLSDAPSAWFAAFPLVRLEGAGGEFPGRGFRLLCGLDLADSPVDFACCRLSHLIGDVGVDVQSGAAGHVTDHRGEGLDVHSVFQGHGGKQVTEVMETDMLAPGPFQNRGQALADRGGVQGQVIFSGRGEHPAGVYLLAVFLYDTQERSGKDDRPVGGFGFGLRDDQFPFGSVNLPFHPQRPGLEIEVIPLEGQKFASTQAGGNLQQEQFIAAILSGLNQQTLDLLWSEHLHFPGLGGRKPASIGRVAGDQFLGDSHLQRRAECGVTAPHRLVGEAAAIVAGILDSPVLLEVGVELLEVILRELVQRGVPQRGDNVVVDSLFIRHLGVGPEIGFLAGLIPGIQPLAQGHTRFVGGGFRFADTGAQFFQLSNTFRLCSRQDIFRFWQTLVIITGNGPALPAAILSQMDAAAASFSARCHGFNSSPSSSVRKSPTTSEARFCISPVTWV